MTSDETTNMAQIQAEKRGQSRWTKLDRSPLYVRRTAKAAGSTS